VPDKVNECMYCVAIGFIIINNIIKSMVPIYYIAYRKRIFKTPLQRSIVDLARQKTSLNRYSGVLASTFKNGVNNHGRKAYPESPSVNIRKLAK